MQTKIQAWVRMSRFGNFKADVAKLAAYLRRDYPAAHTILRKRQRHILIEGISPVDLATGQYLFWPFNGEVLPGEPTSN